MFSACFKFSSVFVVDQHDIKKLLLLGYGMMMAEDFSEVQSPDSSPESSNTTTASLVLLDEEALYLLQAQQIIVIDFHTHRQLDTKTLYQLFQQKRSNSSFSSSSSHSPSDFSNFDTDYCVYSYFKQRK
jgi:hypothetical protein